MVHRMEVPKLSLGFDEPFSEKIRMKPELDEYAGQEEDPAFSLSKRPRLDLSLQHCNPKPASVSPVPVEYNPLDEPSPLGLKLKKSPSFLDLIQMKLSQDKNTTTASLGKTLPRRDKLVLHRNKGSSASIDKLKASNFPATLLKIGTWEYKSRYEGDLVAKCYFAKHKLVWEVLDGGLKNKIEIQWSDIMAIRATYPDDGPESLDVLLARQPLFFREINPQPRKHTLWQATSDFTGGQATIYRRHTLQCSPGPLGKHFKKLIQCDPRLNLLSRQPEIALDNPFFEPKHTMVGGLGNSLHAFDLKTESDDTIIDIRDTATSEVSGSEVERRDGVATSMDLNSRRRPLLPADVLIMQGQAVEKLKQMENLKILDQIKVPGLRPSMSMSDLVSHLGQCITEQIDPKYAINEEQKNSILEDIAHYLLSDSQVTPPTYDEKSIRVNSLCCLLQKEPISAGQDLKVKPEAGSAVEEPQSFFAFYGNRVNGEKIDKPESGKETSVGGKLNGSTAMSRKDSVGDFLLNLPRIASLPRFLFNFADDSGNK